MDEQTFRRLIKQLHSLCDDADDLEELGNKALGWLAAVEAVLGDGEDEE